MNPSRGVDFGAADSAGAIASKNGRASVAPAPCRNVRLDRAFFVINMISVPLSFETEHSLRRPTPKTKTRIYSERPIGRSREPLRHHNIAGYGLPHTLTVSPQPQRQTRRNGPTAFS